MEDKIDKKQGDGLKHIMRPIKVGIPTFAFAAWCEGRWRNRCGQHRAAITMAQNSGRFERLSCLQHRLKSRRILRSSAFLIVVKVDIGRSPRPPHGKQPTLPACERV